jgi:short-subunit dehydrogenase
VVGRSKSKTTALATELGADYFIADFAELSQVRTLAQALRSRYARIDVLANNAGATTIQLERTNDGVGYHVIQVSDVRAGIHRWRGNRIGPGPSVICGCAGP